MPKISIVIPCYFNEGNIIPTTTTLLETEKLFPSDVTFEYVLVDDGSKDGTWNELVKFQHRFPEKVKVLKLARNFGANNASLAGLNHATGDCNVILAADLQDPPELIPKMYEYWRKGIKFVIANRSDREESFRQSFVSNTFHFLMRNFALSNTPKGGYDLTLFDREIRETVVRMDEKNGYLPYLFLWLGYEYVNIPYVRKAREIGVSRWTFSKKLKSFIDSFVAYSYFPIRLISGMGMIFGIVGLIYAANILRVKIFGHVDIEGWSSLMIVLLTVSSFQMIGLGILGEYVWRSLDETRKRPNFIIDQKLLS